MRRQSRRRQLLVTSYTDFPDQYAALLERFARDKHVILGPMPKRSALALQFQLSRWFGFLRQAPPDDEYAAGLTAIAKTMQCSLIPVQATTSKISESALVCDICQVRNLRMYENHGLHCPDCDPPKQEPTVILDWHLDPIIKYLHESFTHNPPQEPDP